MKDNKSTIINEINGIFQKLFAFWIAAMFMGLMLTPVAYSQTLAPEGSGAVFVYTNSTPITINDTSTATPYPSHISVAGITPGPQGIFVFVELNGFTHPFPGDVDILLVGPQGQRSIIMSDAGNNNSVSNLNLVFSDTFGTPIPENAQIVSGAYKPANYATGGNQNDTFPSPGPGTLTNASADLAAFRMTDPNGVWRLFVVDDAGPDMGEITGGWSLTIVVETSSATVTKIEDTNDGICDADCSLREAIASNANEINFSTLFNTPQTITLAVNQLAINKGVTINGPGADKLTIAGSSFDRVFNIGSNFNVTLDGITIRDGDSGSFNSGGGVNNLGNLLITNSVIRNNVAGFGGGVANRLGTLTILNSTISNNRSTDEVGGGGIENTGILTIINSTISGNESHNPTGSRNSGGILTYGTTTIINSTITGNLASGTQDSTGGIDNSSGPTTVRNSIIAGNGNNPNVPDVRGMFVSTGFNLVGNVGTSTGFNQMSDQTGTGANPLDPKLASLGNYGERHKLML